MDASVAAVMGAAIGALGGLGGGWPTVLGQGRWPFDWERSPDRWSPGWCLDRLDMGRQIDPNTGGVVAEPVRVRRLTDQKGQKLQRLPAAATGGLAILIDHAAAVLGVAVRPVVTPVATELLMDGQALRVAKVDVTAGADVRGHELILPRGDRPVAARLLRVVRPDSYSGTPSSK
ncbi:hypothetical protein DNK56_13015 [Streptomyces sp. AC1-42W]|nr:hypothetical protein DNK55_18430 [Streptomyces sp. AC1-42T]PZT82875.1 hypothetical protein DNK56_13015 [Streptomyces sp. AC1-42W]